MFLYYLVILILAGLIFGSFISAVTWRVPREVNIFDLHSRSICPKCKKEILWYDNIPLLSYLLLHGRCRNCHKHISIRYPIIEFSTVILFVLVPYYFLPIVLLLEMIFIIDLEHQIIPDGLTWSILVLSILCLVFCSPQLFFINLLCGLTAALFLLLTHLITKGKGMGLGDVKLALAMGLVLGWPLTLVWLYAAFLTGAAVGVILILVGRAKFRKPIAFGPFLAFAFLIALIYEKIH